MDPRFKIVGRARDVYLETNIQMWQWTRLIGRCITLVNVASEGQIEEKEDPLKDFER